MVHEEEAVVLDRMGVEFDDERLVSDAGIALAATLAQRLGIEQLAQRFVQLRPERPGAGNAGRKVMSLVFAMLLGADSFDDCDLLRSGRTRRLLAGWVAAPSTLGTFLRAFTFGHVRQLDRVLAETLTRAWRAGAGPGEGRLVIDVDSFIGEVYGQKQGATFGYTRVRGYHALLAVRAGTREVLHLRLRKGSANTQRGILQFVNEVIARVGRAGASGVKLLRADSGFWNMKLLERLERAGWLYSITIRMSKPVGARIEAIPDTSWRVIADYSDTGEAQIAETTLGGRRLVVRRVRNLSPQGELFPNWQHHPFLTNRSEEITLVEAEHRDHAVVEQAIRDLKEQALAHFPSGRFNANAAWTVIAALAHNLLRWTELLGSSERVVHAARSVRRRLLHLPGRLTSHAGRWTLHLPARWPWQNDFVEALTKIRALPAAG